MDFNKLNTELYHLSAPYKFTKKPNDFSKGYIKISDWLADLCFHYNLKRKSQDSENESEFRALIKEHKMKIEKLSESEFKKGLLKALSEIY